MHFILLKTAARISECEIPEILKELYQKVTNTARKSLSTAKSVKRNWYQLFWNEYLDELGKKMLKAYKQAKASRQIEKWAKEEDINKRIQRAVREHKNNSGGTGSILC